MTGRSPFRVVRSALEHHQALSPGRGRRDVLRPRSARTASSASGADKPKAPEAAPTDAATASSKTAAASGASGSAEAARKTASSSRSAKTLAVGGLAASGAMVAAWYAVQEVRKSSAAKAVEDAQKRQQNEKAAADAVAASAAEQAARKAKAAADAAAAKKAAEEQAAAERAERERCSRACDPALDVLSKLQIRLLEASWPATRPEAVAALREALAEAEAVVKGAPLEGACNSTPAGELCRKNASTALQASQTRLLELESIARANGEYHDAMQRADLALTSEECRAALDEMEAAAAALQQLGEEEPVEPTAKEHAYAFCEELLRVEQAAARRAAAFEDLKAAVASRSRDHCASALHEARESGLYACPELELAAMRAEPPRHQDLVAKAAEALVAESRLLAGADAASGLSVDDYVAAEAVATQDMDDKALRARAADHLRALMTSHKLQAKRVREEMKALEGETNQRCAERARLAAEQLVSHKGRDADLHRQTRETEMTELTDAAVVYAVLEKQKESDQLVKERRAEEEKDLSEKTQSERDTLLRQIASYGDLMSSLQHFDDVASNPTLGMSRSSGTLTRSLLQAGTACAPEAVTTSRATGSRAGQRAAPGGSDDFVETLSSCFSAAPGSESAAVNSHQLQSRFRSELTDFVGAAFAMPSQCMLSGVVGSAVQSVFAKLYVVQGVQPPGDLPSSSTADKESESTRRNLRVLSDASRLVERGDFAEALAKMEASLTGACRLRATPWMQEARQWLLLKQTALAAEARSRCLLAGLAE
eukprot:TRINITY_DN44375_c0_g3_i1.p1 TRINITY_DN44375_c0_g3~~TRINITY_DN44375_c0_g3_i1.p1  ORF type:complete len:773 (+),score=193.06 TRINITY_DN44375_c0_g3_i1:72-2390(+)